MMFQEYCQDLTRLIGEAAQPFEGTAEELFNELLSGSSKTVIVSMPSLSGKTTIMQLAGFLKPRSKILVFCPTNALINQQLQQLESLPSDNFEAVSLASENLGGGRELSELLERISNDEKVKFVYATPERIKSPSDSSDSYTSPKIRESLEKWIESGLFTDIVCDDSYLDGFRRNLNEFKELREMSLSTRWIIMSTMKQAEIDQIGRDMSNSHQVDIKVIQSESYFRKDIYYEVVDESVDVEKFEKQPSLLYTRYRDDAEFYAGKLGKESADYYHRLSSNRIEVVQKWRQGEFPILAATFDSFRWGIVKIPLNLISHSMYPRSLLFYYLESGRALGPPEQHVVARLHKQQTTSTTFTSHLYNIDRDVIEYIYTKDCRHQFLLKRCFGEIIDPCMTLCDNCTRNEAQAKAEAQV